MQNSKKDIHRKNFRQSSSKKFVTDLVKVNWDNTLNVLDNNVKSFQKFSKKL